MARRVLQLIDTRGARDPELLDLISADPGLALPMIEAANRALAGAGMTVGSLEIALQVLGRSTCHRVAEEGLAATPVAFDDDRIAAQLHAVVTSLVAGSLARILGTADPGEARAAGLLHGVDACCDDEGFLERSGVSPSLASVASGKGAGSGRESEEVLADLVRLAHSMAAGLGASADCGLEGVDGAAGVDRLKDLGEMVHERVSSDVSDGMLVLGVLLGIPRLDIDMFHEAIRRLAQSSPADAPPPEGLTEVVHLALNAIRKSDCEAVALELLVAAARSTPEVERAILVVEEAGEAMLAASDKRPPFFIRTRDLAAVAEGLSELLLLVQREGSAAIVARGMGFDGVFRAFECQELLIVPVHAGEQPVGALAIPSDVPLPSVFAPTFDVLAQAAGEAMERAQMARRSFLLTERITKDGLTGSLQRAHLMELLEAEIRVANRYRRPLAMVMLDIDNFKGWNDSYGHQVGDGLLRDVARAIQDCSREGDLVGRYGGDEFIVVLPGQSVEQAQTYAERVRTRVEDLGAVMTEVCYDLHLSVSLGVAAVTTYPVDAGTLLFRADHALYRAKQRGRNRVHAEQP